MEQALDSSLEILFQTLYSFFIQHKKNKTYWIAYSGGLDSHVLLSLCQRLSTVVPLNLQAIHIQHGLHAQASNWANHCRNICNDLKVNYHEIEIKVKPKIGESLEALAREKRYAALSRCLAQNDVLLTAHHQDDQAETMLLQLLRGAGPKGLAAMPFIKNFAKGWHARPLLSFSRAWLSHYAKAYHLNWIEDPSNLNKSHTRNFIRHDILPQLKKRWPQVANVLTRSAMHCGQIQYLAEEYLDQLVIQCQGTKNKTLSVSKLLALDLGKQKLILRRWIELSGFFLPTNKKIIHIQRDVLSAAQDASPCVSWQNAEIRRYRDDLYLMHPVLVINEMIKFNWDMQKTLQLPYGLLRPFRKLGSGLRLPSSTKKVTVTLRQGGEQIWLNGHHHSLKKFLQEQHIPPWERQYLPLIWFDKTLVCIVGHYSDKRFYAKESEMGIKINFIRRIKCTGTSSM